MLHLAVCSSTHAAGVHCTSRALLSLPAQSAGFTGLVRMQSLQEAPIFSLQQEAESDAFAAGACAQYGPGATRH